MKTNEILARIIVQEGEGIDPQIRDYVRKADNAERRNVLKAVEGWIKEIAGPQDDGIFELWTDTETDLLRKYVTLRCFVLNLMLRPTSNEVERMEYQNHRLFSLQEEMVKRVRMMSRANGKASIETNGERQVTRIAGTLSYEFCDADEAYGMPEDEYYGSDFHYMLNLMTFLLDRCEESAIDTYHPNDQEMENGESWAEGEFLKNPAFSHICFCHAACVVSARMCFSIPDVLRMMTFRKHVRLCYEETMSV